MVRRAFRASVAVRENGLMNVDDVSDPVLTDADRVSLWLMSADGLAAVKRTLRDLRLSDAFDTDLIVSVCHAAGQMVAKQQPIESIPAWTTRTLKLRAIDLVRSPRTSRLQLVVDNSDDAVHDLADHLADPTDQFNDADVQLDAVAVRRQLSDEWHTKPSWSVSAALTVLTVLYDEANPSDDCPQPASGASDVESAHWVGLWYSGKRDLFPHPDQPADNTITKRRSRATTEVRNLLRTNAPSTTGRA